MLTNKVVDNSGLGGKVSQLKGVVVAVCANQPLGCWVACHFDVQLGGRGAVRAVVHTGSATHFSISGDDMLGDMRRRFEDIPSGGAAQPAEAVVRFVGSVLVSFEAVNNCGLASAVRGRGQRS